MSVLSEFWESLDARDWDRFGALLADDVAATWPQTRECCRGRAALLRFLKAYPGDWRISVVHAHGDAAGGATRIDFTAGGETQPGITFFTLDDAGLVSSLEEYWPDPYEPPDRGGTLERY